MQWHVKLFLTYSSRLLFRSNKSSSAVLAHEQKASQKWCLSSRHLTAYWDYKSNMRTQAVEGITFVVLAVNEQVALMSSSLSETRL